MCLYFGSVFVERAQILHGSLQTFGQKLHIIRHVFVVELSLLQDRQLLQNLQITTFIIVITSR